MKTRKDHRQDVPFPPIASREIQKAANITGNVPEIPKGTFMREIVVPWSGHSVSTIAGEDGNIYAIGKDVIGGPQTVYLLVENATEEDRDFYR